MEDSVIEAKIVDEIDALSKRLGQFELNKDTNGDGYIKTLHRWYYLVRKHCELIDALPPVGNEP